MPTLADEVGNYPMLFSSLQILDGQRSSLGSPQPAPEEDGNHSIAAPIAQIPVIEYRKEPFALFGGQPIADPHAMFLNSLNPPDPCREIGAQKPAIRGLVRKSTNCRQAEIDGGRSVLSLLEADPVSGHNGLVKSEAGFRAVPVDEFANGMIV
jgi:hypothetical protein